MRAIYMMSIFLILASLMICGCEVADPDSSETVQNEVVGTDDGQTEEAANLGTARNPVPIAGLAVAGEYAPDPVLVRYEFVFSDGTILKFKENHGGDYWGDYPSAGWGQVVNPDGSVRGVDVNTTVRKGGLGRAKTPVTTLEHGKRMFWMADSEGNRNVKRVDIFEDGWNPLVEGAVLATQGQLGISAHLASCFVKLEKRK